MPPVPSRSPLPYPARQSHRAVRPAHPDPPRATPPSAAPSAAESDPNTHSPQSDATTSSPPTPPETTPPPETPTPTHPATHPRPHPDPASSATPPPTTDPDAAAPTHQTHTDRHRHAPATTRRRCGPRRRTGCERWWLARIAGPWRCAESSWGLLCIERSVLTCSAAAVPIGSAAEDQPTRSGVPQTSPNRAARPNGARTSVGRPTLIHISPQRGPRGRQPGPRHDRRGPSDRAGAAGRAERAIRIPGLQRLAHRAARDRGHGGAQDGVAPGRDAPAHEPRRRAG